MSETTKVACGSCGEDREPCQDCGMCLYCADESMKEGEGYCATCGERLVRWSNVWRIRWHDAAVQQHRVLRTMSTKIGDINRAIDRGGFDLSPCSLCGEDVVCLPEGGSLCKYCAAKLAEEQ